MRSEEQLSCQSHNYHNEWSMRYLPRKQGLASISQSCDAWLFCLILGYLCGIIIACAIVVTKLSGACAANRDAGLDRDNWCRRGCGMACGALPPGYVVGPTLGAVRQISLFGSGKVYN